MYCKYCGKRLPEESRYCSGCGADQRDGAAEGQSIRTERPAQRAAVPFYLMLAAGILVPLAAWTAKLVPYMDEPGVSEAAILKLLVLLVLEIGAGSVLLLALAWKDPDSAGYLTGKDAAIWLCWSVLPWVADLCLTRWIKYGMGQTMDLGYIWSQVAVGAFSLSALWPSLVLLAVFLVRGGRLRRTGPLLFGSGALLILWCFLLTLFRIPALNMFMLCGRPDVFSIAVISFSLDVLSLWLRRLVDLGLMLLLAKNRLSWPCGIGIALLPQLLFVLLAPVFIFWLHYGGYAPGMAIGIAYAVTALGLVAAARKKA